MSTSRHLTGLRRFAKAAVAVCASLGLVLAAGGCGASSGESKTIYFWNNLVGDDGPAMQRIVKEYNAQSDYKVVFQPMNGGDLTTMLETRDRQTPTGRMGDAWDTAWAALYLASDEARYVNGVHLIVDGGLSLRCA